MRFRPMDMSDADFMLALKNDQQTRQFAIVSKEEIKMEDHVKWLEKNISTMYVIEKWTGERVGAIRINDKSTSTNYDKEVSVWIDKKYRELGIATIVLSRHEFFNCWCKIVDGNVASMRAFVKAGFVPSEHIDNYYILKR